MRVSVGDLVEIETEARAEQAAQIVALTHEADQTNHNVLVAAATIVALRKALVQAPHYDDCPWGDKVDGYGISSEDMTAAELAKCKCYLRVLADTAPAARSAKAEIERAAVEPWRAALRDVTNALAYTTMTVSEEYGNHWCPDAFVKGTGHHEAMCVGMLRAYEAAHALLDATPEATDG